MGTANQASEDIMKQQTKNLLPWQMFAVTEGLLKTAHFYLYKSVMGEAGLMQFFSTGRLGAYTQPIPLAFLWTFVVGIVQAVGGASIARARGFPLTVAPRFMVGTLVFAVGATYMTILPAWLSSYETVGLSLFPFMTAAGIVPGVVFDSFFKGGNRRDVRPWIGAIAFLIAVLAYFDFELGGRIAEWQVQLAFTFALVAAINEATMRIIGIGKVHPFVANFWIGTFTAVLCTIGFIVMLAFGWMTAMFFGSVSLYFWAMFILFGVLILPSVAAKAAAYNPNRVGGGTIATKKVVMIGTLLAMTFIVDYLVFGTAFTFNKGLFFGLTIFAYFAMQPKRQSDA